MQDMRFSPIAQHLFTPPQVSLSVPFPVPTRLRSFRLCSTMGRTLNELAKRLEQNVSLVAHPVGYGDAVPSTANQARYLREFINWAQVHKVQYFYFDAFDEGWKVHEREVGTHWGLYRQSGEVKFSLSNMLPTPAAVTLLQRGYLDVYVGGLESGFGLGIDTSGQQCKWLTANDDMLMLTYPANQQWGTMFITVGPPVPPGQRPSLDLSRYRSLIVDLRVAVRGQCVRIGIRDKNQPDNGSEIAVQRCLTTQWSTITLPLNTFANVGLSHVYVVFELVFQGSSSITVGVRNIRYALT